MLQIYIWISAKRIETLRQLFFLFSFETNVCAIYYVLGVGPARNINAVRSSYQAVMHSSSQTLVSYLLSSPLYVLRYSPLLLYDISSLTSFIFRSGYPYWLV